jgi:CHAD domain-containing protein
LGEDPEALHDMRVAVRKSRAAISVFQEVLSPRFAVLTQELKWLGQALGVVRDLDVQSAWLTKERTGAGWEQSVALGPLIEELANARQAARATLLAVMDSERYSELIVSMKKALIESDYATESSVEPVQRSATRMLRKRFSQFEELASDIELESPPLAYHAVRIRGKRLRYALEAFVPVFEGNERVVRVVDSTKRMQDLLGEFQDCITATARLQELARKANLPTATIFLMGQLTERLRARMEEIRSAWPAAHENLLRSWGRAQKLLKEPVETPEASSDEDDGENGEPPPAVQRPFWLLRRFVGQGRARPDASTSVPDNV